MSVVVNGMFAVKVLYNAACVLALKEIDGRKYDVASRSWWFPVHTLYDVANAVRPYFPAVADRLEKSPRFQEIRDQIAMTKMSVEMSYATDAKDFPIPHPNKLDYFGYQYAGIKFAHTLFSAGKGGCLIGDDMGVGKAQPLTAKVLTPSGFINMGDVKVGTEVIRKDGSVGKVTGVFPKGEKPVYRVTFSDGDSCECCDEHLWHVFSPVHRARGNNGVVKELKDLIGDLYDKNNNSKWFIPIVEPVNFTSTTLPIDPYVVGILINEGNLCHSVNFFTDEQKILDECKRCIPDSLEIAPISPNGDYRIKQRSSLREHGGNIIRNELKNLGLYRTKSATKFIPKIYLHASVNDRIRLLQGIMDGDGECGHSSCVSYTTASEQLANDVRFLIQSLGGIAGKQIVKCKMFNGKEYGPYYHYTFRMPSAIKPFAFSCKADRYKPQGKYKPTRSIANIEYVGMKFCQCIKVDAEDELYVTDNFIVTHNTIQFLGFVNKVSETMRTFPRTLLICPASLKRNWQREARTWLLKHPSILVVESTTPDFYIKRHNFVIINYDILKKHFATLFDIDWEIIGMDEAHYIKSKDAQRSKACRVLAHAAGKPKRPFLIELTGTPIVNRPAELWHLLHCIDPNTWSSFSKYAARYCNAHIGYGGRWDVSGAKNLPELQQILRSGYMIRRLKADVLKDLPPKRRQIIELGRSKYEKVLANEQKVRSIYDKAVREAEVIDAKLSEAIRTGDAKNVAEYRRRLDGMNKGEIGGFGDVARVRHETALAKVPECCKFIEQILEEKDKVVVFAHHRDVIEAISSHFKHESVILYGGMNTAEKDNAVQKFIHNKKCRVFVISILAGGVGLTLTVADTAVFCELDYSPSNNTQAEDRLHRVGQKSCVFVYHLVVEDSIDAAIARKCVDKQDIIDKALDVAEE